MSERELEIMTDARRDATRFRGEAERLNLIEVESRSAGTVDDEKLRRIASFLKSYNEMHKGEQFVSREVVARARERNRGWIGGVLVLAAVLVGSIAKRVTRR